MSDEPRFYITTAIAYPNGEPHIGHACEVVGADMMARFHRLSGYSVHFLTGVDDHGQKMVKTARDLGLSAEDLGDRMAQKFREMNSLLCVSCDDFIRTKEDRHKRAAVYLWQKLRRSGDVYLGVYKGWYCLRQEAFYADSETTVQGGVRYGPGGLPVEWVEEESYFFRLSRYRDRLLQFYRDWPDFLLPRERLNEVVAFVSRGLSDLSVSRTRLSWGIPVPDDSRHVMYVWLDALINYISALGYPDVHSPLFQRFWPADVHVVGKDIVRFHAVIWPAILMAAGIEIPKCVFGHGFLLHKGSKMSKSEGNVLKPFDLVEKYGVDALRYFLLKEIVYGQDGYYNDGIMMNRFNADLANDLGNLVHRCLTLVQRHLGSIVPCKPAVLAAEEAELLNFLSREVFGRYERAVQRYQLHVAVQHLHEAVGTVNRYFSAREPWRHKSEPQRLGPILFTTMEALRLLGIQLIPVMPRAAGRLLDFLNIPQDRRLFVHVVSDQVPSGTRIGRFSPLFPRVVEGVDSQ